MTNTSALDDVPRELARRVRRYARATGKTPNAALETLLNDSLAWWEAGDATQPENREPEPWPKDVGGGLERFLTEVTAGNIGSRANGTFCLISHPDMELFMPDWTATALIAWDKIRAVHGRGAGEPLFELINTEPDQPGDPKEDLS